MRTYLSNLRVWVNHWDLRAFYFLNDRLNSRALDYLMKGITNLGGAAFTVSLSFFILLIGGAQRAVGLQGLVALSSSHILVQVIKLLVNRPRPYLVVQGTKLNSKPLKDYSFPSGHSTAAFAMATILAFSFGQYAEIFIFLATWVALSRTYLGLHFPSDILIGALIGSLAGIITKLMW